jgi:hypothetical protein
VAAVSLATLFCGGLAFAPVEGQAARKFGPSGGVVSLPKSPPGSILRVFITTLAIILARVTPRLHHSKWRSTSVTANGFRFHGFMFRAHRSGDSLPADITMPFLLIVNATVPYKAGAG